MNKSKSVFAGLLVALLLPSIANAIVRRHDVAASEYESYADSFSSTGYWSFTDIFEPSLFVDGPACTGVLVEPNKVLTAAHCFAGMEELVSADGMLDAVAVQNAFFALGPLATDGFENNVASIHFHPLYREEHDEFDLAVLTLSTPITETPPATISIASPEGLRGSFVGYGSQGDGVNGVGADLVLDAEAQSIEFDFSGIQFGKRAGRNRLHLVDPVDVPFLGSMNDRFVSYDFDSPDGDHYNLFDDEIEPLESMQSYGDSGGPLFADFANGEYVVAITSGGGLPDELIPPESEIVSDVELLNRVLAGYGIVGGATWLGLDENRDFLTANEISFVPEPTTNPLVLLTWFALVLRLGAQRR